MGREFEGSSESKEDKILLAQMFDSNSTGRQWGLDSPIKGTGRYQIGADLEGNGSITRIEREDANNCIVTLDNGAKLNFRNDHIVKIECPNGSTYEMKHNANGGLSEVKMLSGEVFKYQDGHWFTADGHKTDRQFYLKEYGSLCESNSKNNKIGTFHYPDGTSVSGEMIHLGCGINVAITRVERYGKTLAECGLDEEGYYNRIKLQSGEEWKRQGTMHWKSSSGDVYNGNFYFEDGRGSHLRRKDVHGNTDPSFKPF